MSAGGQDLDSAADEHGTGAEQRDAGHGDTAEHGATAFSAVGSGERGAAVPPDDGRFRLVLVRHGRTDSNVRHALDTALPGAPLDDRGLAQADDVAGLLTGWPVHAVYSSRAARAQQTAAPVAAALGLDVELLTGAHEVFAGELDMATDEASRAVFDETFAAWFTGDPGRAMPGGESGRDVWARFLPDLARVTAGAESGRTGAVVVVSHGAAIRLAAMALLSGVDGSGTERPDAAAGKDHPIPNSGRVVLRRDPDGWTVELWDPLPRKRS
ncbi:histidine phosphatase family protein [Pseudonocardia phyllosphaerae]|uniref:histidine phosphatase family protein n=1 Tax=Pseudonocardia phyllosphaerae TaxID=3390502 RepID=UPI00397A3745